MADLDSGCAAAGLAWYGEPLESARLTLRPPKPEDAEAITAHLADGRVAATAARIPHPYRLSDALTFIEALRAANAAGEGLGLAMIQRRDGALLGMIGAELAGETAEIGYWVGPDHWGKGFAGEAVRRLLRLLFATLKVARVRGSALPENAASLRIFEGNGFTELEAGEEDFPAHGRKRYVRRFELTRESWLDAQAKKPALLVAAVALVDADGRVLIASRPEGKAMAGLWEFPGGKVGPGETPEAALIRELQEELGVDTRESCLAPLTFASHDYDRFHLLMPLYACRIWKGEPRALEGQRLKWVKPVRLGDYPMPPADLPLIAMLRDLL